MVWTDTTLFFYFTLLFRLYVFWVGFVSHLNVRILTYLSMPYSHFHGWNVTLQEYLSNCLKASQHAEQNQGKRRKVGGGLHLCFFYCTRFSFSRIVNLCRRKTESDFDSFSRFMYPFICIVELNNLLLLCFQKGFILFEFMLCGFPFLSQKQKRCFVVKEAIFP